MAMKKSVKKKWVAALRSGKYKQGKRALRDSNNKFCSLGVLCDIARQEGVIPNPIRNGNYFYYGKGRLIERSTGTLPVVVQTWAGVEANPLLGKGSAVWLNDNANKSFEEIADLIEEHL